LILINQILLLKVIQLLNDNVLPTKDYNIQLSFTNTDEETVELTNFKGELEVSEIG
jgi:hypothetical protein